MLPHLNSSQSTKNTQNNSTSNLTNNNNQLPPINLNKSYNNPLINEKKLNLLESRLNSLEQTNDSILNRLNSIENKQIEEFKRFEFKLDSNKFLNNNNNNNNNNNFDDINYDINLINNKISQIEILMAKENEFKLKNRKSEIELYQRLLEKLNSSLTNTIKLEIEERFKADYFSQKSNEKKYSEIDNSIDELKNNLNEFKIDMENKITEINNQSIERSKNLSLYVDRIFANNNNNFNNDDNNNNNNNELKNFISKLTEQIKTNIINQNIQNQNTEKRLNLIENSISSIKNNNENLIKNFETRIVNKLLEIKKFAELNINQCYTEINNRINNINDTMDHNIIFILQTIQDQNVNIKTEFENINKKRIFDIQTIVNDFNEICNNIYQMENIIKNQNENYMKLYNNCNKKILNFDTKFEIAVVNERMIHEIEHKYIMDYINNNNNEFNKINNNIMNNINEVNKNSFEINQKVINRINTLQNMITDMTKNNYILFNKLENNENEIASKQILNEIMFKLEDEFILREINKIKQNDLNVNNKLNQINVDNKNINKNNIDNNKENVKNEIEKTVNDIINKVEFDYNMKNIRNNIQNLNIQINNQYVKTDKEINNLKELINKNSNEQSNNNNINNDNNKNLMGMNENEVKNTLTNILNEAEFKNIYNILNNLSININKIKENSNNNNENINKNNIIDIESLQKQITDNNNVTKKVLSDYADLIDNKITSALEKLKQDNINMWTNAVQLSNKYYEPQEITKLIQQVPPTVYTEIESRQKLMDLNFEHENPEPFVGNVKETEKKVKEERYGNNNIEKKNNLKVFEDSQKEIQFNNNNNDDNNNIDNNINNNSNLSKNNSKKSSLNGTKNSFKKNNLNNSDNKSVNSSVNNNNNNSKKGTLKSKNSLNKNSEKSNSNINKSNSNINKSNSNINNSINSEEKKSKKDNNNKNNLDNSEISKITKNNAISNNNVDLQSNEEEDLNFQDDEEQDSVAPDLKRSGYLKKNPEVSGKTSPLENKINNNNENAEIL